MQLCCMTPVVIDATIDFSPNPSAKDLTLTLEEDDLLQATSSQIDRFLRVWVSERHLYAPKLKHLVIELIVSRKGDVEWLGIRRFLEYYQAIHTNNTSVQIRSVDGSIGIFSGLRTLADIEANE